MEIKRKFLLHGTFLLIVLSCFHPRPCTSIDRISINQSIHDPEYIVSSNHVFKLGFFSPPNTSNRYVGIMYNVSVQTVVWVANRDKPLKDSSGVLTVSEDGNLVILDGQETILWSSSVSEPVANSTTELLDNGNLVLRGGGRTVWESFQNPTDSYLKQMRLATNTRSNDRTLITSWRSISDPSVGSFSFGLEILFVPQLLVWKNNDPYWRSGPWNGQIFIGIERMSSFYRNGFDLLDDNAGTRYLIYSYSSSELNLLHLSLNATGSLEQKVWMKEMNYWDTQWSSIENECDIYGRCGPFGFCRPQGSPICTCLHGFKPKDEVEWSKGNWTGGCIRKSALQCDRNTSGRGEGKQDGFLKLGTVKVPDFSQAVADTEDGCRSYCLNNCSCLAYGYYTGIGCMFWSVNLVDIQQFSTGGGELYIRLAHSELDKKAHTKVIIAVVVIVGSICIAIAVYASWKWLPKHRGRKHKTEMLLFERGDHPNNSKELMSPDKINRLKLEDVTLYAFEMLANATQNFHSANRLGQGGFGPVYKGKLPCGKEIAVKRLSRSSGQGLEEFMNEVVVISKLQHRNLVRLLGCCVEKEEKLLVYEYMPNGSLDASLFGSHKRENLDWNRRAIVIEGIGRGLLYLHRDSRLRIIHRDLKASNILLDEELNPKISDFGMARIFGGQQDRAKTHRVVGTYGYMAPEYAMQGTFSEKSDVYSFGVLLLEIVSGRRNTSFYNDEHSLSLLAHAWKLWNEDSRVKFIDPLIFDSHFEAEMLRYIHVGLLCVQEFEMDRPNVSTVLSMLSSEIAELPYPKLPAFTVRQSTPDVSPSQQSQSKRSVNNVTITIVEGR